MSNLNLCLQTYPNSNVDQMMKALFRFSDFSFPCNVISNFSYRSNSGLTLSLKSHMHYFQFDIVSLAGELPSGERFQFYLKAYYENSDATFVPLYCSSQNCKGGKKITKLGGVERYIFRDEATSPRGRLKYKMAVKRDSAVKLERLFKSYIEVFYNELMEEKEGVQYELGL